MAKSLHNTISFAGGNVSPKLDARVDQQKYGAWTRQCVNMVPYKSGGLTRRVGTQLVAPAKYAVSGANNYAVRHVAFTFSPGTTFTLEFGHEYVRFYAGGNPVASAQVNINTAPTWVSGSNYVVGNFVKSPSSNLIYYCILSINNDITDPVGDTTHWHQQTIYEVPSPYNALYTSGTPFETDVFLIETCQINDIVYIVHPDYPPYSLSRFGSTDWVMEQVPFLAPALLDQNATDTILTPSQLQGTGITLTASAPAWIQGNYYDLANSVEVAGVIYDCILANVSSSSFATDLAAGYWQAVSIFNSLHIGSTWQLAVLRSSAYTQWGADAGGAQSTASHGFYAGTSNEIQCLGAYEVHTYGVWAATIAVQRSLDGGQTWDTVQTVVGASDRNVDLTGTAVQLGIYRIVVSNVAVPINAGATAPRVIFECEDAFLYGTVQITGYTSATQVTGNVITELTDSNALQAAWVASTSYTVSQEVSYNFVNYTCISNTSGTTPPSQDATHWGQTQPGGTEYWSEAAWSDYRGYPQAITSFQQRIIYGGSGYEPQRSWGTVTNDIQNFALGDQTQATDAFAFDLNAPSRGPIVWMVAQTDLFIGFSGAEWVVNSGSTNSNGQSAGSAITPTNINAFEQGTYGSAPYTQPSIVGNAVFFAQRQADAIRQMLFSVYTEKYMSQDLTTLADHLFAAGIVQIAYQGRWRHQGILWAVTQQGTLCGLTYDLDQEVFGWFQAQTGYGLLDGNNNPLPNDNGFESVCVLDGDGTSDDEVWVVANRLINGVQTRFIERINPNNWEEEFTVAPNPPGPNIKDAFYVDCGQTATNVGTTIANSYLPNRWVVGLADGVAFPPVLLNSSGVGTIPNYPSSTSFGVVQFGIPITYAAQPMRFDSDPRAGNTQGLVKQVSDVYIRVWNSLGGNIGNGTTTYPTWVSGMSYAVGANVISPLTLTAFNCVTAYSGATDPSQSASWVATPTPVYQQATPIPYAHSQSNPFSAPVLVTKPTDIRIGPMLNPVMDDDPQIIVSGSDALPLTVLAIILKYDVTGTP